jgi:hypothetical protein
VRVALAKYENIHWGFAGWSPKIHKVGSERSPTARETVPHLRMIVRINGMYVATYFYILSRVGTHIRYVCLLCSSNVVYL